MLLLLLLFAAALYRDAPLQAGQQSNQTEVRFELWRRVKADVFERWEDQTCSLNPAKPSEPVSIEAEGVAAVQGVRHRLQVS